MASKIAECYFLLKVATDQLTADLATARNVVTTTTKAIADEAKGNFDTISQMGKAIGTGLTEGMKVAAAGVSSQINQITKALETTPLAIIATGAVEAQHASAALIPVLGAEAQAFNSMSESARAAVEQLNQMASVAPAVNRSLEEHMAKGYGLASVDNSAKARRAAYEIARMQERAQAQVEKGRPAYGLETPELEAARLAAAKRLELEKETSAAEVEIYRTAEEAKAELARRNAEELRRSMAATAKMTQSELLPPEVKPEVKPVIDYSQATSVIKEFISVFEKDVADAYPGKALVKSIMDALNELEANIGTQGGKAVAALSKKLLNTEELKPFREEILQSMEALKSLAKDYNALEKALGKGGAGALVGAETQKLLDSLAGKASGLGDANKAIRDIRAAFETLKEDLPRLGAEAFNNFLNTIKDIPFAKTLHDMLAGAGKDILPPDFLDISPFVSKAKEHAQVLIDSLKNIGKEKEASAVVTIFWELEESMKEGDIAAQKFIDDILKVNTGLQYQERVVAELVGLLATLKSQYGAGGGKPPVAPPTSMIPEGIPAPLRNEGLAASSRKTSEITEIWRAFKSAMTNTDAEAGLRKLREIAHIFDPFVNGVKNAIAHTKEFTSGVLTITTSVVAVIGKGLFAGIKGLSGLILSALSSVFSTAFGQLQGVIRNLYSRLWGSLPSLSTALGFNLSTGNAGVAALEQLGSAIRGTINEFAEAEHTAMRFAKISENVGATVGLTSKQLAEMTDAMYNMGTSSRMAIQQAQGTLMTFNQIQGATLQKTMMVLNDFVALTGRDLPHAAHMLGMAMQDPERAMWQLRRSGVALTRDEYQAMKATHDLATQQDILLNAIQRSSKGMAEAMRNTLSGQLQILKNDFELIRIAIGEAFAPALKSVLPFWKDLGKAIMENMGLIRQVAQSAADLAKVLVTGLTTVVTWFRTLSPQQKQMIFDFAKTAATALLVWKAFDMGFDTIKKIGSTFLWLLTPIGLISAAAGVLMNRLTKAMADPAQFQKITVAFNNILKALTPIFDAVLAVGNSLMKAFLPGIDLGNDFAGTLQKIADWINQNKAALVGLVLQVGQVMKSIINMAQQTWAFLIDTIGSFWSWLMGRSSTTMKDLVNDLMAIGETIQSLVADAGPWFEYLTTLVKIKVLEAIAWIADNTGPFLGRVFKGIVNALITLIDYLVGYGIASFKRWGAESTIQMAKMAAMAEAFARGIRGKALEEVGRKAEEIATEQMFPFLSKSKLEETLANMGKAFKDAFGGIDDDIINRLKKNLDEQDKIIKDRMAKRRREIAEEQGEILAREEEELPPPPKPPTAPEMAAAPELGGSFKYQFSGITDMWKKIQENLSQGSMLALTKGIAENTKKTAQGIDNLAQAQERVADALKNPKPALMGQ